MPPFSENGGTLAIMPSSPRNGTITTKSGSIHAVFGSAGETHSCGVGCAIRRSARHIAQVSPGSPEDMAADARMPRHKQ